MTRELPAENPRLVTPYRIGVSVLLAAAFAALYVAFLSAKEPEPSIGRPTDVVSYSPSDGATALRQSRIVAQLRPGLVGILVVDGKEIPEDQLEHLEGANWVGYTPGPGTETGVLEPGPRCAIVVYWTPEGGRRTAERFRWCWQVH